MPCICLHSSDMKQYMCKYCKTFIISIQEFLQNSILEVFDSSKNSQPYELYSGIYEGLANKTSFTVSYAYGHESAWCAH